MRKVQKTIDVWVASDGSEHLSETLAELQEIKLGEQKLLSAQAARNAQSESEHQLRMQHWRAHWENHPDEKDAFLEQLRRADHASLEMGVEFGWWESFDEKRGVPIPFPDLFIVKTREVRRLIGDRWCIITALDERQNTMAHLLAALGIFESVTEARKNGWNKPIVEGEFWFQKKTKRVQVVNE